MVKTMNVWVADALIVLVFVFLYFRNKHPKSVTLWNIAIGVVLFVAMVLLVSLTFTDKKLSNDKPMQIYSAAVVFTTIATFLSLKAKDDNSLFFNLATFVTLSIGMDIQYEKIM